MDMELYTWLIRERCTRGVARMLAQQDKEIRDLKKKVEFMYNTKLFEGYKDV